MTDDAIIRPVLDREGRFANRLDDAGGPTNFGITLATLAAWRNHPVTAEDVERLTEVEAIAIYRKRYLEDTDIAKIANEDVRAVVLDAAVNHGPRNGIKMLQRALGLKDDGILGPITLAATPYLDGRKLALRVLAERTRFFGRLISHNLRDADRDGIPDNTEMAAGWLDRVADQIEDLA